MSEYMFGCGRGWLSARANKIAKNHGAVLIQITEAQCMCGHGCRPRECKESRRHWFATDNKGEPFNTRTARAVEADLEKAGINVLG